MQKVIESPDGAFRFTIRPFNKRRSIAVAKRFSELGIDFGEGAANKVSAEMLEKAATLDEFGLKKCLVSWEVKENGVFRPATDADTVDLVEEQDWVVNWVIHQAKVFAEEEAKAYSIATGN